MKKRFLSYSIALVLVGWGFVDAKAQQPLKVGSNPTNINKTAVLDVEATNKGALLPRVALTSITDVTTIANPSNALTVFNTATAGTAPNNVTPGYYYYSTAINKWVRLLSQGDAISATVSNTSSTNSLTTTVNGVTGAAVNIINSNALAATNGSLVSTVNGQASSGVNVLTSASSGLTAASGDVKLGGTLGAATTITTGATNTLAIAGLQTGSSSDRIVVVDASTNVLKQITSSTIPTTVSNTVTAPNSLTTTVNGVTGTGVSMVTGVSNASSTNSLTTTVNGVTGTAVNIINGNTLTAASNAITSTVNGVASVLTPTAGGTVTENLGFNAAGNLVRQTVSAANTPNIYTADGTLTGNRTINVGSNSLNFLSNASGNNVLWNLGRTATEMDMGVAGSSDAGLAGTVAGDGWVSSKNNLFVGAQGTGSFNVVTGASPTWGTRLSINSAGNMGVGTTSPTERLHISGNIRFSGALMPNNAAGTAGQVLTSAGAGAPPTWTTPTTSQNIYNTDGTISGDRGITLTSGNLYLLGRNLAIANSGSATNATFRIQGASNNNVLDFGNTTTAPYIQSSVGTNLANSLALLLNPNGGNVGVRVSSPSTPLHVRGVNAVPVSTTTSTNAALRIDGSSINNALDLGVTLASPFASYIQSVDKGTNNSYLPLTLQPLGGNLGIGTYSPGQTLDVNGTVKANAFTNGTTAIGSTDLGIYGQTNAANRYVTNAGGHAFYTDGASGNGFAGTTPSMLLTSTGNLGIGTSSPGQRLDVNGTVKTNAITNGTTAIGSTDLGIYGQANAANRYVTNAGGHAFYTDGTSGNGFAGTTASMLLTSTGSLGIGTTSPSQRLDVNGTAKASRFTNGGAVLTNSGNDFGLYNQDGAGAWTRYVVQSGSHAFFTDGANGNNFYGVTPAMILTSAGRLGLGTTTPAVRVHVRDGNLGVTNGGDNTASIGAGNAPNTGVVMLGFGQVAVESADVNVVLAKNPGATFDTSLEFIKFRGGTATIGGISSNTNRNGVIYSTTSDMRLKENIVPTHLGLSAVKDIKVYDYNFKTDPDKTQETGVLAQELYKIFPQAVSVGGDDPKKNPWAVDYGKLTPLLVKAIQEQQLQIEALKKEVENLKNK